MIREAGWAMVELVLTLFLLGFIISLVVPSMSYIGERIEREMFLHAVTSDLRLAQTEALGRQEEVVVQVSKQITVKQGGRLIRKQKVPARYRIKTNYSENNIIFRKTGQVRGGTIQLLLGDQLVALIKLQVASGCPKVETILP